MMSILLLDAVAAGDLWAGCGRVVGISAADRTLSAAGDPARRHPTTNHE